MNQLSLKSTAHHAVSMAVLFIFFSCAPFIQAQSLNDHDHDEEATHGESHDEHEGHDEHAEEGDEHGDEHGGPIELSPADIRDFGIVVETAAPGTIHDELRLQGEVKMNENQMGHVSPRFGGVVTNIHKRLGDTVQKGEVLATMESNETLRPFDLKAPLNGTIVDFHITNGESLEAGEVAYTVSDTSTVWVDLRVYQRDLPKVHTGQKVRISAGHEYEEAEGNVAYIGPMIDETTRTGLVRVVLTNPSGTYRPGLFIIGNILLDAYPLPVVVPRSAVISVEDANVVFVEAEGGHGFEKREVELGQTDAKSIAIRSGLNRGERYVSEGGFFLKADLQKENFGDGHGH